MLKYIGLAMLFSASVLPALDYGARHKRKMAEYELFIRLADGIYEEISTYMRPISDFLSGLSEQLSAVGLSFSPGCDFGAVFEKIADSLLVSAKARSSLAKFFSVLGSSHRTEELSRVRTLRETLVSEMESDKLSGQRSVGAVRAVCCAVGLIFVILLV